MTVDTTLTPLEQLVLDLEAAADPDEALQAFLDYDSSKARIPL